MRFVVLDTETTGLNVEEGHRVIEIGCVELRDRAVSGNEYYQRINPMRDVDRSAEEIHGMNAESLKEFPVFKNVADEFCNFITGSTLIIHNADFDRRFLDAELNRLARPKLEDISCEIIDTLKLARELYPMKRASLDALCNRFGIDRSMRNLHGALLDARLLAEVYLSMTRGQEVLGIEENIEETKIDNLSVSERKQIKEIKVVSATENEIVCHDKYLERMQRLENSLPIFNKDNDDENSI